MVSIVLSWLLLLVQFCFFEVTSQVDQSYDGPWRKSFDNCWTQNVTECNRAMTISHGGDWDVEYPYDSFPAFQRAYANGADTVKGDFRVSLDNIGMVSNTILLSDNLYACSVIIVVVLCFI